MTTEWLGSPGWNLTSGIRARGAECSWMFPVCKQSVCSSSSLAHPLTWAALLHPPGWRHRALPLSRRLPHSPTRTRLQWAAGAVPLPSPPGLLSCKDPSPWKPARFPGEGREKEVPWSLSRHGSTEMDRGQRFGSGITAGSQAPLPPPAAPPIRLPPLHPMPPCLPLCRKAPALAKLDQRKGGLLVSTHLG